MAQLAEAAERADRLERDLGQAQGDGEEAWAHFWATMAFSLALFGFRWGWALLAAHFTGFPRIDPIER